MSRYKAYPSYKETRHSWLENVPAHWKMLPLKFLTAQHVTDGPHETPEFIDEGVPFLSVDGIQNNQLVFEGCRHISREDHARYSIKCKPNQGDVLLGKAASVGKVAHVDTDIEFNVWSPLAVIRPRSEKTGRFIYYSLQSALLQMQCDMYSNANTQKNLGMSTIDNLAFASPTDDEAEQVANFLDHETAKIDALIEKQQRLIELLKEKRQAAISRAVTKGLNPNAPMKDSGVEWLGEVPAHWQVAPLKRFADVIDCKHYTVQFLDEGLPIVSIRELRDDLIDISNAKLTSRREWNFLREGRVPRLGDIVFCRNASVGAAGYVSGDFDFCMGQDVCLIRTGLANRYMHFQITARHVREQIEAFLVGATIRRANVEEIRGLVVAYPPENEQKEIEKHLETVLSEFDTLSEKAGRTVALLIERRTALISAAVTGKIDVRDWQAAA